MILILNIDSFVMKNKLLPIISPVTFLGKSTSFHPQGLFSEEIFGLEGSEDRREKLAYIDLNCNVIHPELYDIITKRIDRKFSRVLSGESTFSLDKEGLLIEDPDGDINGMIGLVEHIDELRFRKTGEGDRDKLVELLYSNINKGTFFMNKVLVVSPVYRPISVGEGREEIRLDDMNHIYRKIIILSSQVRGTAEAMLDILSHKMQLLSKELYEFVRVRVSKKQGIIRNLMLGKRVDFSARAVISPNPNLRLGEVGIPLTMACSIFEPHLIYGLVNSPESSRIPDEFHESIREFLGKERGELVE